MPFPRLIFLGFLALAAALPGARALPTAAEIAGAFREIDTTGNQAINAAEWQRASFALFRAADTNNNDFIDADELKGSTLAQDTFLRLDQNRDGRLNVAEFNKLRREIFTTADLNRDDYLTLVEYELLIVFEAVGWQDRNQNERMDISELRAALTKLLAQLDRDGNAQLDSVEAGYMPPDRFERFDKNKDRNITAEELVSGYRGEFEA